MDIYCKVTPTGFTPLYDSDYQLKKQLKEGSIVRCRVSNPRNYKFHKKFFALLRITFDNLPAYLAARWNIRTEHDMLKRFKRDLGYFTSFRNEYGELEIEYLSISFAAMEQHEFEKFYDECIALILNNYIRGLGREDLEEEIENFM